MSYPAGCTQRFNISSGAPDESIIVGLSYYCALELALHLIALDLWWDVVYPQTRCC